MRACSCSSLASEATGPPHSLRSTVWVTPCGWPLRWCQAATSPLSSRRSSARRSWVLTRACAFSAAAASSSGVRRAWAAFCAAAALPHLHPERRRTLLQSISESAATAPGWSNREPVFWPEWVEKVDVATAA